MAHVGSCAHRYLQQMQRLSTAGGSGPGIPAYRGATQRRPRRSSGEQKAAPQTTRCAIAGQQFDETLSPGLDPDPQPVHQPLGPRIAGIAERMLPIKQNFAYPVRYGGI